MSPWLVTLLGILGSVLGAGLILMLRADCNRNVDLMVERGLAYDVDEVSTPPGRTP